MPRYFRLTYTCIFLHLVRNMLIAKFSVTASLCIGEGEADVIAPALLLHCSLAGAVARAPGKQRKGYPSAFRLNVVPRAEEADGDEAAQEDAAAGRALFCSELVARVYQVRPQDY